MLKLICLLIVSICSVSCLDERPIIGVLTQPSKNFNQFPNESYIAASYVKFFESGGSRVVPIMYNSTEAELEELFQSVNAIFFPGGAVDLKGGMYEKTGKFLFDLAIKENDKGVYFPVYGHCLGFELLMIIVSEDFDILDATESENISLPLKFTKEAKFSKLFGHAPADIYYYFGTKNITLNNHHFGVYPETFKKNHKLTSFFEVLSTNTDEKGREFISTVEAKHYPIYSLQWHAEKPQFEWLANENINHSLESIQSMSYLSQFYVEEARKNNHHFSSPQKEHSSLIYNYLPIYCDEIISDFEQCYPHCYYC